MLGQNNACGIRCAAISFVAVAIVPTSVGIRGTEVQFLTVAEQRGEKTIFEETMPGATCSLSPSHGKYSQIISTKS